MDPVALAQQFLQSYYGVLMGPRDNRGSLASYYQEQSQMFYQQDKCKGLKEITDKINSFGFQTIQYKIDECEAQFGPLQGSILVFVTGQLQMDGTDQFKFTQCFNLCQNQQGGYYVHNDIFKIVL